jgi:predicted transcriptional regulator
MLCPVCRYDNFEGEDTCENCGADLRAEDIPRPATEYRGPDLGVPLDALGIGEPAIVEPGQPVGAAIERMHAAELDCLLVCDGDRLVGIFTDRDAVVKAAGKRLSAFDVRDFMTPDPVVLRHDETVAVAINKMAVGGFRHIPVVDGHRPIGVITAADVFRHLTATVEA